MNSTAQPPQSNTDMLLSQIKCGDRVRLRYQGCPNGVAKRYGDTWGTVTSDSLNTRRWEHNTTIVVSLDAIGGPDAYYANGLHASERRVRLDEIGAVERAGLIIAERQQAPASAADQFPLRYVKRIRNAIHNAVPK